METLGGCNQGWSFQKFSPHRAPVVQIKKKPFSCRSRSFFLLALKFSPRQNLPINLYDHRSFLRAYRSCRPCLPCVPCVPTVRHRSLALKFSPGTKIFSRSYLILFSPRPGDRRPGGESEWSSLALTADKLCRRGGRAAPGAAKTSTVPYCTVLYCTVQYSTIQYCTGNSTVQYSTVRYGTVQYSTVQLN